MAIARECTWDLLYQAKSASFRFSCLNCGYIVGESARGKGVASLMCQHSQQEAKRLGFRAMQFNLVVSTNKVAVRLWQKCGFEIVGILTGAFKHSRYGFVDAFVMYKQLET